MREAKLIHRMLLGSVKGATSFPDRGSYEYARSGQLLCIVFCCLGLLSCVYFLCRLVLFISKLAK